MNRVNDQKYRALLNLLLPVGSSGMKHVGETPWSLPETRTFTCSCGVKRVVPTSALTEEVLRNEKGEEVDRFVNVNIGDTKCTSCGSEIYELLTFCNRYGLIKPVPKPRPKKRKEELLPLSGGIQCGGGR
jgi:hypothetical protein